MQACHDTLREPINESWLFVATEEVARLAFGKRRIYARAQLPR